MAHDRTNEFFAIVKSIQSKPQYLPKMQEATELRARRGQGVKSSDTALASYADFMNRSRATARDLVKAYSRLQELSQLSRKTTLYDWEETSRQLNQLILVVKQDIRNLTAQVEELKKLQSVNPSFSSSYRSKSHNMESHASTVILNLQQSLASMSSDFKATLEIRSQNQQKQAARRQQFSSPESASLFANGSSNSSAIIDFNGHDSYGLNSHLSSQQQQQQQQLLVYEDNSLQYLEERANAMQSVESTIVELGTIFNQLATMVQQQEEMIGRIDANVADAALNVESAHEQLLQYFRSISSNRWLMIKVFGVLFVFFLLFAVFAI